MVEKNLSPLKQKQEYIWFAKYSDDVTIYEFDDKKQETSFYDIDPNLVQQYGLLGNGLRLYFDKESGVFNVGGKKYPVSITVNDIEADLTKFEKKLVHFKLGHTDALLMNNRIERYIRNIDGYFFGYRLTFNKVNIQIIFGIPVAGEDRRPFFGVKLSSSEAYPVKIKIGPHENTTDLKENKTETYNIFMF